MCAVWFGGCDLISNVPISAELESKHSAFDKIIYIYIFDVKKK